jgi:hypothetical protein
MHEETAPGCINLITTNCRCSFKVWHQGATGAAQSFFPSKVLLLPSSCNMQLLDVLPAVLQHGADPMSTQ